jgi:hypothetical protein
LQQLPTRRIFLGFLFLFTFLSLHIDVDGAMGFSDMLEEPERMILDGEKGKVVVGTANWAFEARNETEISFPVGGKIRVMDQHESGWWTGQYNGQTGFFPGNRTLLEEIDMMAYKDLQKKLLMQPMFVKAISDDAPALPDPMVKAGKILGISEKEAEALSSKSPRSSARSRQASVSAEVRKKTDILYL